MKKIILFLFFNFAFCIFNSAFCQNQFVKRYDPLYIHRIVPTSDLGFVGTAVTDSMFIYKFDSVGEIQWTKIFSYPGYHFFDPDIIELQNKKLFITSIVYNSNLYTCINLLLDSLGNLLYAHENTDSLLGLVGFHIAGKTNLGDVIYTGTARLGTLGGASGFITKVDSTGNFKWSRTFFTDTGTIFSRLPSIVISDDNTIITGTYHYNFSQKSFFFVTKFDSSGNSVWFKQTSLGISSASWADVPVEINGNYYIMASLDTPMGNPLVPHLYKMNSFGDLIWHAQYDFWTELFPASFKSSDDNFTFMGRKDTIPLELSLIVEIDSSGIIKRNQIFTNPSLMQQRYFFYGCETCSGEKVIYGAGGGSLIATLDSSLKSSCFSESINLNSPVYYPDSLLPAGIVTPIIFSYSDVTSSIFVTSSISTSIDWCNLVSTKDIMRSNDVFIYPNPVDDNLNVKLYSLSATTDVDISIYNVMGEKVYMTSYQGDELTVDCKNFPPGIYFVEMTAAEKSYRTKFIKQ